MPIAAKLEEIVEIPEEVNVKKEDDEIEVSGPNGTIRNRFSDKRVNIDIKGDKIELHVKDPSKREKALLGTYSSHLQNMVKGVQEDFQYKLKIVYSHFPVKVRSEGDEVVIENFVGEKKPRRAPILGETNVEIKGDEVLVTGLNKDLVAQTAANIESTTRIKNTDSRVFQDGIYIIEKAGKALK
ncbi:MAG: 50S ribosomal protein L6 [Candidatus Saliniplasma sp.]